jgi:hypothetical protein
VNSSEREARARRSGETIGQRLLALIVFVVLGVLLWLAYSGRYDGEVNRLAHWLHGGFDAIRRLAR